MKAIIIIGAGGVYPHFTVIDCGTAIVRFGLEAAILYVSHQCLMYGTWLPFELRCPRGLMMGIKRHKPKEIVTKLR